MQEAVDVKWLDDYQYAVLFEASNYFPSRSVDCS